MSGPRSRRASALPAALAALALGVLLAAGCAGTPVPVSQALSEAAHRRPVILVPGVTGSKLREPESRRVIWGRGIDLLRPRDGGYALALPLGGGEERRRRAEAFEVIERISLLGGLVRMEIYGPIFRLLEANGYRRGDLDRPVPEADFYPFAYDWRGDLTVSAARLMERLEELRRARGERVLEVDLICQSAGGQICRYAAKFGGAQLAEAAAGRAGPSATIRVAKVILVGTSNGGSIRIVRELDRGRRYIRAIGRALRPEVLFSFPSLFQDLPVYRRDAFVDESGQPLDLDLLEAATWRRLGVSIFAEPSRRRIARRGRADLFGDAETRMRALERHLDAGRRLHEALLRDVDGFVSRYYSIQNVDDDTSDRAVVTESRELLFTGDKALRRRPQLHAAVTAGGDGHATRASQQWLSAQEHAALAAEPLHLRGDHFAMILDPQALRRILDYLAD